MKDIAGDYEAFSKLPKGNVTNISDSESDSDSAEKRPKNPPVLPSCEASPTSQPKKQGVSSVPEVCNMPGCSERDKTGSRDNPTCALCETTWHEVCVQDTFTEGYTSGFDEFWCCMTCISMVNGPWDQLL